MSEEVEKVEEEKISIPDQLKQYLGQLVGILAPEGNFFGVLHTTPEGKFGFPPHSPFDASIVKEIRKIEVEPEKNMVRAVIVL